MTQPQFPANPGIGQIFPGTPVPHQTTYVYMGEEHGWVPKEIQLKPTSSFGRGARRRDP